MHTPTLVQNAMMLCSNSHLFRTIQQGRTLQTQYSKNELYKFWRACYEASAIVACHAKSVQCVVVACVQQRQSLLQLRTCSSPCIPVHSAFLKRRKAESPALYAGAWGLAWRIDVADGRARAYHVLLIVVNNQERARAIVRFDQVVTQVQIAHWQAHLRESKSRNIVHASLTRSQHSLLLCQHRRAKAGPA